MRPQPAREVVVVDVGSGRSALRTGRATLTASGSPCAHTIESTARVGRRPLVQLRLHREYSGLGLNRSVPEAPVVTSGLLVQPAARVSLGPVAGHPRRARSGRRTRRARAQCGRGCQCAAHRCGRASRRDALGPAPGAAGPSRPDDRHRSASRPARPMRRRHECGARTSRDRHRAHGAAHPRRPAAPGAARAVRVSPPPPRRRESQSRGPTQDGA